MKFTWDLIISNLEDFHWSALIKARGNKLPPTKIQQKFTPFFTSPNFNEIGCKQCNENDHNASIFVTFKYCTWNPRKDIPGVRGEFANIHNHKKANS